MYVKIGPYKDYLGPYQIVDKIFFWVAKYPTEEQENRWDYKLHEKIGDWLANTWVTGFCRWIDDKKQRRVKVQIDPYDTWGMDHTLALIIVPMLKQLRDTKHGSPYVDPEDCPHIGKGKETAYGHSDDKVHERWDWALNEMIYAFECEVDDDWDSQFYSGEIDHKFETANGVTRMVNGPNHTWKIDVEARDAALERRNKGRMLFAKYYNGLWD